MRLLLAEDNRELAHWLEKALVQEGFAVDCVSDGRAADHLLQGEHYAVAILDIGMPGFDGLEVVHRLRKRGQTLPVLFLTARSNVADRVKGLNAGMIICQNRLSWRSLTPGCVPCCAEARGARRNASVLGSWSMTTRAFSCSAMNRFP